MSFERSSEILAFTPTWGNRPQITATVKDVRRTAGLWFDWAVYCGAPSLAMRDALTGLAVQDMDHLGVQRIEFWPENRGQHHAFAAALALAREHGYPWLLRLDDDIQPRQREWLKKMRSRLDVMKREAGDEHYRLVAVPRITGLLNPLSPLAASTLPLPFPVEFMEKAGGAVRLLNVEFFRDFVPDIYLPVGRGDPEAIESYLERRKGATVRFPDIRVKHETYRHERDETKEEWHTRLMGHIWPWLGACV